MGSRILSRSFQVERWTGEHAEGDDEDAEADEAGDTSAMDVDPQDMAGPSTETIVDGAPIDGSDGPEELQAEVDEDEDEDEEQEDPSDVAMVPMADMLNARFESENVSTHWEVCHLMLTVLFAGKIIL